jgi:hypothetical protein
VNTSHQLREGTKLMLKRFACFTLVTTALLTRAWADTPVMSDDFESYSDSSAMQTQWVSSIGSTTSTFLFDSTTSGQPYPVLPTIGGLDGKAALFDGTIGVGATSINKWATPFSIAPSATQNVFLSVDLGYDHQNGDPTKVSNKKLTVGLRFTGATPQNLIELGFYNGIAATPVRQFSHRTALFASGNPNPNPEAPGWEYYGLDPSFDQMTEMDHSGNALTNGLGFHRFTAEISLTNVTYTVDLFADGINNVTGLPGVDATDVVAAVATASGFNDLRFGIPSGSGSSANPLLAIDNVELKLKDITVVPPTGTADFDDDGDVDGRDFLTWQRGFGINDGTALLADGDANDDGNVNGADLTVWQSQYGEPGHLTAGVTAVPEPSTSILLLVACSSMFVRKRR